MSRLPNPEPTVTVRAFPKDNPTKFAWTVHYYHNGLSERAQGAVSIARVRKELGFTQKRAKSEAEARAWDEGRAKRNEIARGLQVDRNWTVERWCDHFCQHIYAPDRGADEALKIRGALAHHLYPSLGKVSLKSLSWEQVLAWWEALKRTPRAAPIRNRRGQITGYRKDIIPGWKTRDHLRIYVTQAIEAAFRRNLIPYNPAKTIPQDAKLKAQYIDDLAKRKKWFSEAELKAMRKAPESVAKGKRKSSEEVEYAIVLVQQDGWCRASEACALHIEDIDVETGFIAITKQRKRSFEEYGGPSKMVETAPKGDGIRCLVASPELIAYAERRGAEELAKPEDKRSPYLILGELGKPLDRHRAARHFRRRCEKLGIDLPQGNNTHAIRRSVIELGKHAPGVSSETRAFLAGHDSVDTTKLYEILGNLTSGQKSEIRAVAKFIHGQLTDECQEVTTAFQPMDYRCAA